MPSYPIPPWLQVAPAQFGEAAAAGARIDLGRAQLAEESRQNRVRAALMSQQMAAESEARQQEELRKQQEAAISHQYDQQQIALKTKDLDLQQQAFEQSVSLAAMKSAAQQMAARRIASGEEPSKVWAELGPQVGLTGAGLASLMKSAPNLGEKVPVGVPGYAGVRTSAERIQLVPNDRNSSGSIQSQVVLDPVTHQPIKNVFGVRGQVHNIPPISGPEAVLEMARIKSGQADSAIPPEPAAAAAPATATGSQYKEGTRVRSKSRGVMGTIINGVPVWDAEPEPETPVAEENPYESTGLPGTKGFYYSGENYDTPAQ